MPGDAEALEADWAARVRANRDQVDRLREVPDGTDFYRTTSSIFRDDPFRTDDPVLDALIALAQPADAWLDIGAGAGRYALPLARHVREVVALDPSTGMLRGLREAMTDAEIANVRPVQGRWPADAAGMSGDVALIAHVGYDVERIGPFVDAMEAAARRRCVAVLMRQAPASAAAPFWPAIHGEQRALLPALDEFVALLAARGTAPDVQVIPGESRRWPTVDELLVFLRQQTWVEPAGEKDRRLRALVAALPREADDSIQLRGSARDIGIVAWQPAHPT